MCLQVLELEDCDQITTAGVIHLAECIGLHRLAIDECEDVCILDLGDIATLSGLSDFQLVESQGIDAGDEGFPDLRPLASVTRLVLEPGDNFRTENFVRLAALTCLRRLMVSGQTGCSPADDSLAVLTALTGLTALGLCDFFGAISGTGLTALRPLSSLQWLDLAGSGLSKAGLHALATLTQLCELKLKENAFVETESGDIGASLCKLTLLSSLSLARCTRVKDVDVAQLAVLSRLRDLNLEYCSVTDAGLAALYTLPALNYVCLEKCSIG
jgi:F-box and leucine-rich repeat protein 14